MGGTFAMALCGSLLVATGDYRSLFVMTGILIFVVLLLAWLTIERGPAESAIKTAYSGS